MKKQIILKIEKLVGRKSSRLFLIGILFSAIALTSMLPMNVNAAIISVPDDYPTIQQAINAAGAGDVVYVRAGTYYEHVTISKSITLQGEDKETTIIDGGGNGHVIYITTNYITISGFTVANGENGIKAPPRNYIDHLTLKDVIITLNHLKAFDIPHNRGNHLIENCIISDNHSVSYSHGFSNCIIRNNEIFGNQHGLNVGWGSNTLITNNHVHHNNGTSIHFDSMFNSIIEKNNIHDNGCGVEVGYVGSSNTIRDNIISHNSVGVRFHEPRVRSNRVYHNDFIDNTVQAQDNYRTNIWDNGYPSGGNYYSDYTGEDLNNDGIGDTPYVFVNNQDNYPLMQSLNNLPPVADCQNITVSANEHCEAIVTAEMVNNNSYDPDGDPLTLSLDLSSPFQLGETAVTLTVMDNSGESDQCTATITVVDDSSPMITTFTYPNTLWPPNHKYASFNLDDFVLSVSDNCSALTLDDVVISIVTSDEPEDAKGGGDGNTTDDMIISDDCKSIQLRKERYGNGNGRVYTIYLELNDGNGNTGSTTCQVKVPHNNGETAFDDGPVYEVVGNCGYKSLFFTTIDKENSTANLTFYPNPFNGSATIEFAIPETEWSTLKVYNSLGTEVISLYDGMAEGGEEYSIKFSDQNLPQGLYLIHFQSGAELNLIKKVFLMK